VLTITGPRRAGKSFIMRQAARELTKKGVEKTNILMVNLEDPRFTELDVKLLGQIYETYLEFFPWSLRKVMSSKRKPTGRKSNLYHCGSGCQFSRPKVGQYNIAATLSLALHEVFGHFPKHLLSLCLYSSATSRLFPYSLWVVGQDLAIPGDQGSI
jgi:hypothetical protein